MAKPWAKLEINYINHPKFLALTANAICLWHECKNYCDMHLTDGLIPTEAFKTFRFNGRKSLDLLTQPIKKLNGEPYAPFLEAHPVGYRLHEYLEHNDCREVVLERIAKADASKEADKKRKADARAAKAAGRQTGHEAGHNGGQPTGREAGQAADFRSVSGSIQKQHQKHHH